jgi:hypothetical protein
MAISVKGKVRASLRASLYDGLFASGMLGLVDTCLTPFAIAMSATPAQIANLGSLPNLFAAVVQSQAHTMTDWLGSRKRMLTTVILIQALVVFAMGWLAFWPSRERVTLLIGLAMFYIVLGGLASPVWGSLMCEYLPLRKRSGYFGWRNRILGLVIIGVGLVAGRVLEHYGKDALIGFWAIFLAAAIFRIASWMSVRRMFDPEHEWGGIERRRALRFEPNGRSNFFRFLLFNGVMMAGVQLSGPLQAIYLLKDLQLNYFTYMLLISASNLTMFFMMGAWGKHADVSGNLQVIRAVSWVMPVIPVLWLVSFSPVYLFVLQLGSGLAWAGYNLCVTNFIYDSVPASERVRATALYNMSNGVAIFVGAMIGGQLLGLLPPLKGHSFLTLNLLSGLVRILAVALFLRHVGEVRHVQQVRTMDLFYSVVGLKPIPGMPAGRFHRWLRSAPSGA